MFKDDDDSESELDSGDERLDGWKPPTASGVDNSKALSSYDDIASGNVRFKPFKSRVVGRGEIYRQGGYRVFTVAESNTFLSFRLR